MKKIYLKDLGKEELKELIMNNNEFLQKCGEMLYEDCMLLQEEEIRLMFGKDRYKYIDIIHNYTSFYLRLKNWNDFINNLDENYLCDEAIKLYDYIVKKIDILNNINPYSKNYDLLEEHIENKCVELLEICESQLHKYEEYPTADDIFDFIYDNDYYDGYYTNKEKKNIYEDISYTKAYS